MNDRLNAGLPVDEFAAIPAQWDEDPTAQVRVLRDEVARQRDFPTAQTHDFMSAACNALESLPKGVSLPERAETMISIARFHYLDGQPERAANAAAAAVRAAVSGGHRRLEIWARLGLGTSLKETYDFRASLNELARALELTRAEGDPEIEAKVLNNIGNWYLNAGQHEEALAIFERVADYFQSTDDNVSAWMALDNAASAALALGEIKRGLSLAERAAVIWSGVAMTALERFWVVQGLVTNCQLLLIDDRAEEARELAHVATATAEGLAGAECLAAICESITAFATGAAGSDAIDRVIGRAKAESPSSFNTAVSAAVRIYERLGQSDRALAHQRELLAFNKQTKFDAVHLALGRPSLEEADGVAQLTRLSAAVFRKVNDLVNAAIDQSLRSGYDYARIFRVSRLAELFAASEGWSTEGSQSIALAAKLIDLGMMVVSNELLTKPRELSAGERKLLEEHARFGAELLLNTRLALLEPCVPVVRFHHERWDGSGPSGLTASGIPIEARVVALCDAFDALTHQRPWRPAFSAKTALKTIDEEAGSHFDPGLAGRFTDWVQTAALNVKDFESQLSSEAMENDYVRARTRIDRLVRASV